MPSESGAGAGPRAADRERVEQAVRALRAGEKDEEHFDFLFQRFSPPLRRQLMAWGASPDEARDLNQDAFIRIFQDVEGFQGEERIFESWVGWIWKIARTTWLRNRRFKQAAKRRPDFQPAPGLDEISERTGGPAGQLGKVIRGEAKRMVREAVDELPEQEQNCVILFYYQGMKTRQISVVLRIAEGTVKAHLSHARAKLKKKLGPYFEFDDPRRTDLAEEQRV
ncbi:MAG TPA: sigma-70 family RNA polymerase sigma factor [Acidobacteriota bacterium]|nr:sigma-70 family RNA polymerase sigma factor [Acidobacteriota bacterium]